MLLAFRQPPAANPVIGCDYRSQITQQISDSVNFICIIQGKPIKLYVLKNKNNALTAITNYGGRLVSLLMPDKNGVLTDVTLGYDGIKTGPPVL